MFKVESHQNNMDPSEVMLTLEFTAFSQLTTRSLPSDQQLLDYANQHYLTIVQKGVETFNLVLGDPLQLHGRFQYRCLRFILQGPRSQVQVCTWRKS